MDRLDVMDASLSDRGGARCDPRRQVESMLLHGSLAILVSKDFRPIGFAPPVFAGFALIVG